MAEGQKRRHFAREWLSHSVSETSKSTRNASLGLAAGVGVLTGLVNWLRSWHSGHPLSPWGLIWPGLAVAGIVLLALFLFHFLATPFRMAKRTREGHASEVAAIHARHEADLAAAQQANQAALMRAQRSNLDMERKLLTAHRDVESREAQITALRKESVSPEHLEQIKRICEETARIVSHGGRSSYDDPKSALRNDARTRTAIAVHCPDVVSACDLWDDLLLMIDETVERLKEKIESEVDHRHLNTPPWRPEFIGTIVLSRIRQWVGTPDKRVWPIELKQMDSRTTELGENGDLALCGDIAVLMRAGGLTPVEVQDAQDQLNQFVDTAVTWSDSEFLRALEFEKEDRQKPAQIEALRVLPQHSLPKNGGCPLC